MEGYHSEITTFTTLLSVAQNLECCLNIRESLHGEIYTKQNQTFNEHIYYKNENG